MRRWMVLFLLVSTRFAWAELPADWRIERAERHIPLDGIERVEIRNPIGDLRSRGGDPGELALFWVGQRHQDDPAPPELKVEREQSTLRVSLAFPATAAAMIPGQSLRRADLAVFVPDELVLALATDSGLLESKGHKGQLEVRSLTGPIRLVTSGAVRAESRSGPSQVTYKNQAFTRDSEFATRDGAITLSLLQDPDLRVAIETDGIISTDYSLRVQPQPGGVRKRAEALIGAEPRRQIRIHSTKGDVRLVRIPQMLRAEPPQTDSLTGDTP